MEIGPRIRRRSFLQLAAMTVASGVEGMGYDLAETSSAKSIRKRKVAVITTTFSIGSVAERLTTRLLEGYWIGNNFHESQCDVASLCVARMESTDLGRRISEAYDLALVPTIAEALMLGESSLAVDGILLVGEDADRNTDSASLKHDSRFRFFQQIVDVFERTRRTVPVFCAGYMAGSWSEAKQMVQWSREMKFPLMAGTSAPVTFRRPDLDYPLATNFDDAPLGDRAHHSFPFGVDFNEALVICPEGFGSVFCGLEILQAFLERRRTGETGIRSIECLLNDSVWRAADEGRWSKELMQAATARSERRGRGRPEDIEHPAVYLIEHNDGTRSAILSLAEMTTEYLAAFRLQGRHEIDSTLCYTPVESGNDFSILVKGFSQMLSTGMSPYPIERNLLTTGALLQLAESKLENGGRIETPMLKVDYVASNQSFYACCRGW
jgi:hypothetical protein